LGDTDPSALWRPALLGCLTEVSVLVAIAPDERRSRDKAISDKVLCPVAGSTLRAFSAGTFDLRCKIDATRELHNAT
jgi:hypothetical protein